MDTCFIIPPHMLKEIARCGSSRQQRCAWESLAISEQMRGQRLALSVISPIGTTPTGTRRRTIYDAQNEYTLPGRLVRSEGSARSKDKTANEAYDGAGITYDLFKKVFERNSIDGRGMRLDSTVHYGRDYDNAFWNGQQMVYGDGDGELFNRFTIAIDVIGHELTHGVTQFEAGLEYQGQSGALNESLSDVFGSLVKQYKKRQEAAEADWIIGKGLFTKNINGKGLRSMKEPGSAYDDPVLGRDPQPGHMKDYVNTREDNGGVHINSGIPNRAFYETAIRIGGHAWLRAGWIWYVALRDRLRPDSDFNDAANLTAVAAGELYGSGSLEHKAVKEAWAAVGISG
ncbi:MAG: M4 family metallopeptidase [Nitrospirae bacterium]|nr:M4 family metallopeptidase [Nitrospirota bacterium]